MSQIYNIFFVAMKKTHRSEMITFYGSTLSKEKAKEMCEEAAKQAGSSGRAFVCKNELDKPIEASINTMEFDAILVIDRDGNILSSDDE